MRKVHNLKAAANDQRGADALALRRSAMQQIASDPMLQRSGFSARLNMLCSLAGERELNRGRIEDLSALDPDWDSAAVACWLRDDQVPDPRDLRRLVLFLQQQFKDSADPDRWEAFLIYGPELIDNPALKRRCGTSREMLALALTELQSIAQEYAVPADSYDVSACVDELAAMLSMLNIAPDGSDLQGSHRRILAARLFPSHASL